MDWQFTFRLALPPLLALAAAGPALANGINPPRPADSHPLAGSCKAWTGQTDLFSRVRLDAGEGNALAIRRAGAVATVALGEVETLTLLQRKADRNGEIAATLARNDGSKPEAIRVVTAVHGKPVRIVGFSGGTSAASKPISECRSLSFERQRDPCAEPANASSASSAAAAAVAPGSSSASALPAGGVGRPTDSPGCAGPSGPAKKPISKS
jgi:hypothetical protein